MMKLPRAFIAALALAFGPVAAQDRLPVVATFSVLADLVSQVGGEAVQVSTLVAAGSDVHVFQPGPDHARQLAAARLVVANGLGFEGWIDRLIASSGYQGPVTMASAGVEPLWGSATAAASRSHAGHSLGKAAQDGRRLGKQDRPDAREADPHAWQSVPNVKRYVANIAAALCAVGPASCEAFRDNARRYTATLDILDRDIRAAVGTVPVERRKVITSHDAFGYYAWEYGVRFLSPVGVSTDAEPSAAAVGRLIRQIRDEEVSAFFVERLSDPRLIERIRSETGGARSGTLYADGLSAPEGPAASYAAMMRFNTHAITAALSGHDAALPAAR